MSWRVSTLVEAKGGFCSSSNKFKAAFREPPDFVRA
ncbi:hypothetical protein COLO4_05153 [Corchorus olitorius]|uniref:Uncharacterized protein n=1 Tax=Corchorus olitorius TaxID=93759 RepID=A0A1R3KRR4_9ROSI|nr:hypothetical protein COLO4_05153 [Corchorus olitorius]